MKRERPEGRKRLLEIMRAFTDGVPADPSAYLPVFPEVVYLAKIHRLQPVLYYMALRDADRVKAAYPELMEQLRREYKMLIYMSVHQEQDVKELAETFRDRGVRLVFFKGAKLRDYYPEPAVRTMGDLDCVIREKDRERAHELMLGLGYRCMQDSGPVWVYRRRFATVEMHTKIATVSFQNGTDYEAFFSDAAEHASGDGVLFLENEYHICFLFYHIAKHLSLTGAGVRMIMDIAAILKNSRQPDWEQIMETLRQIRLDRLACMVFLLCRRWFGSETPAAAAAETDALERQCGELADELEDYILPGGVFGFETRTCGDVYRRNMLTVIPAEHKVRYRIRLFTGYFFPGFSVMKMKYPFLQKSPWLLPAAWVMRWSAGAFKRRGNSLRVMRVMSDSDTGRAEKEHKMLRGLGL